MFQAYKSINFNAATRTIIEQMNAMIRSDLTKVANDFDR